MDHFIWFVVRYKGAVLKGQYHVQIVYHSYVRFCHYFQIKAFKYFLQALFYFFKLSASFVFECTNPSSWCKPMFLISCFLLVLSNKNSQQYAPIITLSKPSFFIYAPRSLNCKKRRSCMVYYFYIFVRNFNLSSADFRFFVIAR